MNIIGLSGSLRKDSFNTLLLKASGTYLPEDCDYQILSADLPLYDAGLDSDNPPEAIRAFKQKIADADGLLIATPEYNYSFSGVLKNAIDWASRPAFESPLKHKPIALLSASMSPTGGARAQAQLRPVLCGTLSVLYPSVDFLVPMAQKVFAEAGQIQDEVTANRLQKFISGYLAWLKRIA